MYQNWSKKNVENLEIGPDSETLISNTYTRSSWLEPIVFHPGPGGGGPCVWCGDKVPTPHTRLHTRKQGYLRGAECSDNWKNSNELFFVQILVKISQSSFSWFKIFSELFVHFENKSFGIFQKKYLSKPLTFFRKVENHKYLQETSSFSILNSSRKNNF